MRTLVKLLTYAAIAAVLYGVVHFGILAFAGVNEVLWPPLQNTCFSLANCTLSLLWVADTGWLQMTNNAKVCESCEKAAECFCRR